MTEKITFSDLSIYLKIMVVWGTLNAILTIVAFSLGFVEGYFGLG